MSMDVGTILDALIMILLCVTIYYAARLSLFMTTFREGRADFDRQMDELGRNILRAEQAIKTMRELTTTGGQELREVVNESKFLSDELRFMNEAGDSLASRLEKLAERNRELVDLLENAGGVGPSSMVMKHFPGRSRIDLDELLEEKEAREKEAREKAGAPFFNIQDREFDSNDNTFDEDDESWDAPVADTDGEFQSQAERELYEALQKGRKKSRAGGVA